MAEVFDYTPGPSTYMQDTELCPSCNGAGSWLPDHEDPAMAVVGWDAYQRGSSLVNRKLTLNAPMDRNKMRMTYIYIADVHQDVHSTPERRGVPRRDMREDADR
jgi:hypothetical protein